MDDYFVKTLSYSTKMTADKMRVDNDWVYFSDGEKIIAVFSASQVISVTLITA